MSFMDHLGELRTRILRSLGGLLVVYLLCLTFAKDLLQFVLVPFYAATESMRGPTGEALRIVNIRPLEQFQVIYIKVPLIAAVFLAAPWLMYPGVALHRPGLYKRERRWAVPFIFSTAALFIMGGAFCYFVALRVTLQFLLTIGIDQIEPYISVSEYLDTFIILELGLALVFQLPVLIFFFTLMRLTTPAVPVAQRALRHPDHVRHRGDHHAHGRSVHDDALRRTDDPAVLRRHRRKLAADSQTRGAGGSVVPHRLGGIGVLRRYWRNRLLHVRQHGLPVRCRLPLVRRGRRSGGAQSGNGGTENEAEPGRRRQVHRLDRRRGEAPGQPRLARNDAGNHRGEAQDVGSEHRRLRGPTITAMQAGARGIGSLPGSRRASRL